MNPSAGGFTLGHPVLRLSGLLLLAAFTVWIHLEIKVWRVGESPQHSDHTTPAIDQEAPHFSAYDVEGREIKLVAFRGQPVLLDFSATWCPPCLTSLQTFQLAHTQGTRFQPKVLVIFKGEERTRVNRFMVQHGYSFTAIPDPTKSLANLYNVKSIPVTMAIDSHGYLRQIHRGELDPPKLEQLLKVIGED